MNWVREEEDDERALEPQINMAVAGALFTNLKRKEKIDVIR